ncbi:DUF3313 domain-containing protein [Nitratidesulfovibrio termitidis]|uniref:DUF3313 domain-containing protein n=1 Tax=Nitratidesulfovibrio termitidis TaxID=42252 RepID=UPI0006871D63|nr:DUF3313 domain-containing protein [Nitratidesulfovibrio termitidis]
MHAVLTHLCLPRPQACSAGTRFSAVLLALIMSCMAGCGGRFSRAVEDAPLLSARPTSGGLLYSRERELLRGYTKFQVAPVVLREERPETFGDTSLDEKAEMSFAMHDIFVKALRCGGWDVTETPGPGVARLRLMIFGMQATQIVPSDAAFDTPFGRIDLSSLDDSGTAALMGGILIGGELTDARTGARLLVFMERCSVTELDPIRGFGRWDAARSGVEASADTLVRGWNRVHGR